MDYGNIKTPQDLKRLNISELGGLCERLRERIINVVENNGGHLASNLGTVELTVALHYVFDCPRDKFIFDVGHQAYTHKLLTDRADKFDGFRVFLNRRKASTTVFARDILPRRYRSRSALRKRQNDAAKKTNLSR